MRAPREPPTPPPAPAAPAGQHQSARRRAVGLYVEHLFARRLVDGADPDWVAGQLLKLTPWLRRAPDKPPPEPPPVPAAGAVSRAIAGAHAHAPASALASAAAVAAALRRRGWPEPGVRAADLLCEQVLAAAARDPPEAAAPPAAARYAWGAPSVEGAPWQQQDAAAAAQEARRQGGRQRACAAALLLGLLAAAGAVGREGLADLLAGLTAPPDGAPRDRMLLCLRLACMLADGAGAGAAHTAPGADPGAALWAAAIPSIAALGERCAPLPTDLAGQVASTLRSVLGEGSAISAAAAGAAGALGGAGAEGMRLLQMQRRLRALPHDAPDRRERPLDAAWRPRGVASSAAPPRPGAAHRPQPGAVGGRGAAALLEFDALFAACCQPPPRAPAAPGSQQQQQQRRQQPQSSPRSGRGVLRLRAPGS
eukprot:TRINITY_DN11432_c0_g1_i1.p2 TRINITY_DN11432_c0_g1~~TRINITY_DN11432_c0_g1_i1.p2  ORF type:complete len:446 (+),score=132.10 TRINITY_DN11432_c0_g1_i1:69-1340(+)